MTAQRPRIIARLADRPHPELLDTLRSRLDELGLAHSTFDAICGIASGLTNKVLSNERRKPLGLATALTMLEAAGLELWVVERPDLVAKLKARSDYQGDRWPALKREKHNAARRARWASAGEANAQHVSGSPA